MITITLFGSMDNLTVKFNKTSTIAVFNNKTGFFNGIFNITGEHISNFTYDKFTNLTVKINFTLFIFTITGVENFTYGEYINVTITVSTDLKGFINISYGNYNEKITLTDENSFIKKISSLDAGNYNITIYYSGDDYYSNKTIYKNFTVLKVDTEISFKSQVSDLVFGEEENVLFDLSPVPTGTVTVTYADKICYLDICGEELSTLICDLDVGCYDFTICYDGDCNYKSSIATVSFNVLAASPNIEINIEPSFTYGDLISTIITFDASATGTISVKYGDFIDTICINNSKGVIEYEIELLNASEYDFSLLYNGDKNHKIEYVSTNFVVLKADPYINLTISDYVYGGSTSININFANKTTTGSFNVTYAGNIISSEVDGKHVFIVSNLNADNYQVKLSYAGDNNYNSKEINYTFTVNKANPILDLNVNSVVAGENITVSIGLPGDATGNLTFDLEDNHFKKTINSSTIEFTVQGLKSGPCEVKVGYSGDDNYNNINISTTTIVSKVIPEITVTFPETVYYGENFKVNISLPANATGDVKLKVGSNIYTSTLKEGMATFNVSGLLPNNHPLILIYLGDDYYGSLEYVTSIQILKIEPKIEVIIPSSINLGDLLNVIINTDENITGKITLQIDDKPYSQVISTNQTVFNIPHLTLGTHSVIFKYSGDSIYNPGIGKHSFNVVLENPIITTKSGMVDLKTIKESNIPLIAVTGE